MNLKRVKNEDISKLPPPQDPHEAPKPQPVVAKKVSKSRLRRENNDQQYGYRLLQRTIPHNLDLVEAMDVTKTSHTQNASKVQSPTM